MGQHGDLPQRTLFGRAVGGAAHRVLGETERAFGGELPADRCCIAADAGEVGGLRPTMISSRLVMILNR